jgi:hypothetical protein
MKIIATTQGGFILEATELELANVAGYYSKFSGVANEFKIGSEIAVNAVWSKLDALATAKTEIKAMEDKLQAIAVELKGLRQDGPLKNLVKAGN